MAGKQNGQTDARGLHYVEQSDGYIRAKVPVILFEQVPEARRILSKDWKARKEGKSPQDQLIEKLRDNGYTVPDGPDGQAGMILNAAGLGGVLDRKRLFTVAIIDELWEHSNGKEIFKWPEEQETQKSIKEVFREPIREDHLATEHMKQHFEPRERYTKTGVHYKYYKDEGLGEWYNPNTVIGEDGRGVSITAGGNSRWVEFRDIDGATQWRRLSGHESGRAVGLKEWELDVFQHLSDAEIHTAVGNGVCIEQGQALGHTISKFWDANWFYNRAKEKSKKQDAFCLQAGEEISVKNDVRFKKETETESEGDENGVTNEWMNGQDANELRNRWYKKESDSEKQITPKTRRKMRKPKGDEAKRHRRELQKKYNEHIQDERCKFRRRVQDAIGTEHRETHELPEDANLMETTFDGEACNVQANIPLELALERKPNMPTMKDEGCDLRAAQEKDPQFGPLIDALEDRLEEDLPQIQKQALRAEVLKYTLHGSQNVLCKVTTSDRTSSTIRVCVPRSRQDQLLAMCHDNPWSCHPTADQMYKMLSLRYYWPYMRAACMLYQQSCDTCQRTGYPPKRNAGGRQYIPTASPFACCAIDVVGPIGNKDAVTARGNQYIVTIIDWFTRWVMAVPVASPTEKNICFALEKFTAIHGIPRRLVSDNASYFRSKLIHQYEKNIGLKHTFVSAYRPQGNGKLERFHRVLGRKIKMSCQEAGHEEWDEHVDKICFAHNIVPHSITGYSPFELVYGRLPCTPFDTLQEPQEEFGAISHKAWIDRIRKSRVQCHQIAYENMTDRQQESTQLVAKENLAQHLKVFRPGTEVLLDIPNVPKGKSKKLNCRWHGPYTVTQRNKGRSVTIAIPQGDGGFKDKQVHVARIKEYLSRENIETATVEQSREVFDMLEEFEVRQTEEGVVRTGFDMLRKRNGAEHKRNGEIELGMEAWERVIDDTPRVGIVSGTREEEEVPIPPEEKSPFDGEQLIEQAICDLTGDENITVVKCRTCNRASTQHACWGCFEAIQDGSRETETFPVFRGANEAESKKANNLITDVCSLCKKDIWIPELRCQCTETRSPEQVQKDTLQEQEEVELETQVRFNTKYPVLLQKNKVRPGVYQGKKGIPLRIKAEVWENIDSDKQGTKTIRETEKSDPVKVETETEKKPIYETRAILDYQEWDKYDGNKQRGYRYKYPDETWQNIQDLGIDRGNRVILG